MSEVSVRRQVPLYAVDRTWARYRLRRSIVRQRDEVFRDPAAAEAGGYTLAAAGALVALGLTFHPLPAGGLEEKPSLLAQTPLWGAVHVAIALGFVLCVLGGLLVLVAGGRPASWTHRFCWGAITVGMVFFTGVA